MGRPDIRFALGLDGLSLWLFVLTSLLMITAIWCVVGVDQGERRPHYYAFLLALQTGLLGPVRQPGRRPVLHLLRVHADPAVLPDRALGGPQRRRASVMFFLYTLAGSLLTLLGVIALVVVHYQYSRRTTC